MRRLRSSKRSWLALEPCSRTAHRAGRRRTWAGRRHRRRAWSPGSRPSLPRPPRSAEASVSSCRCVHTLCRPPHLYALPLSSLIIPRPSCCQSLRDRLKESQSQLSERSSQLSESERERERLAQLAANSNNSDEHRKLLVECVLVLALLPLAPPCLSLDPITLAHSCCSRLSHQAARCPEHGQLGRGTRS